MRRAVSSGIKYFNSNRCCCIRSRRTLIIASLLNEGTPLFLTQRAKNQLFSRSFCVSRLVESAERTQRAERTERTLCGTFLQEDAVEAVGLVQCSADENDRDGRF